jgi:hypothetical protein
MSVEIHQRHKYLYNTDPQRRCYNGAHFSSKLYWTDWTHLETCSKEKAQERLTFWREVNDYAIEHRGEEARREFKLVPIQGETL